MLQPRVLVVVFVSGHCNNDVVVAVGVHGSVCDVFRYVVFD